MQRSRLALATLAGGLAPIAAEAQLAPQPNATEYLNYLNASSAVASTGLSPRVYVGPYQGRFEYGGGAVSDNFALYCVDYLHYASNSDGAVNVYGLGGDVGTLSTTRFDEQGVYLRAAYLSSLFDTYAGAADRQFQWSALHAAIWRTTSGTDATNNAAVDARADYFFSLALNDLPGDFDGSGWYVLSSVELAEAGYANASYDKTGQEFLIRAEATSVPEPGSMMLLATGLLFLVFVTRRRALESV